MNRIRMATDADKSAVNAIRKQVHMLHASERGDMFRSEFSNELAARFDEFLQSKDYRVAVCVENDKVIGFVVIKTVSLPESPYAVERNFLLVEELGVDRLHRRQGAGSELIDYVKEYARENKVSRIQLDMWTFNGSAEDFYRSQGFAEYRKYMEIKL